jgi:phage shock protein A
MPTFIALILILLLAGCSDDSLRERNAELQQQVAQLQQQQLAIDYWQHQAGIAEACDAVVPLCPPLITDAGHAAERRGYRGGSSWTFWTIFLIKFTVLGALCGGALAGYRTGAARWLMPAQKDLARARSTIEKAEHTVFKAREKAIEACEKAREAQALLKERRAALASIQATHDQLEAEIEQLQAEIERLEAVMEALRTGFQ